MIWIINYQYDLSLQVSKEHLFASIKVSLWVPVQPVNPCLLWLCRKLSKVSLHETSSLLALAEEYLQTNLSTQKQKNSSPPHSLEWSQQPWVLQRIIQCGIVVASDKLLDAMIKVLPATQSYHRFLEHHETPHCWGCDCRAQSLLINVWSERDHL